MNSQQMKFYSGIILFALLINLRVSGANRYWVGNNSNKNWSVTSNWSATSGGLGGASVPTTSDSVYVEGTGQLILDVNINIKYLMIKTSYTDTIKQSGKIITVGTSGMLLQGGIFLGDNADITVNGPFTLTGGSFRSTSKKLTIVGNYTHSAGTFTHNIG